MLRVSLLRTCAPISISLRLCTRRDFTSKESWLETLPTQLQFTQLQRLAVDESLSPQQNQKPRLVQDALFTKVDPTPLQSPRLLSASNALSECLDLAPAAMHDSQFVDIFSGDIDTINSVIPHCTPYSHCYVGHQFGNFAGQLGDGRAICLGEYLNHNGKRWEIQLKGAGLTPYSRFADGRAVLRSSIREYLMSEAMYYLGVPTTRAATLISSEVKVIRDEFYNGNPRHETVAVVSRLSPSFIRFGSFEICSEKGGPSYRYKRGDEDCDPKDHAKGLLAPLLDYVIEYLYPEIHAQRDTLTVNEIYEKWWVELVHRTAMLVAKWQSVGFVHGVLNTDNMSIVGLTLDYGPFGMMDYFYDDFVPNYSDHHGRYSYRKQPEICRWNLDQLAEALDDAGVLEYNFTSKVISRECWNGIYTKYYRDCMRCKFGLIEDDSNLDQVVDLFFGTLQETAGDFTNCFRALNRITIGGDVMNEDKELIDYLLTQCASPVQHEILKDHRKHPQLIALQRDLPKIRKMKEVLVENPEMESLSGLTLKDIESVLRHFDTEQKEKECALSVEDKRESDRKSWTEFVKLYRKAVDKQVVDGKTTEEINCERLDVMNRHNPRWILRNYVLQNCINAAETGDFSMIDTLLRVIEKPFEEQMEAEKMGLHCPASEWSVTDCVSCSS